MTLFFSSTDIFSSCFRYFVLFLHFSLFCSWLQFSEDSFRDYGRNGNRKTSSLIIFPKDSFQTLDGLLVVGIGNLAMRSQRKRLGATTETVKSSNVDCSRVELNCVWHGINKTTITENFTRDKPRIRRKSTF